MAPPWKSASKARSLVSLSLNEKMDPKLASLFEYSFGDVKPPVKSIEVAPQNTFGNSNSRDIINHAVAKRNPLSHTAIMHEHSLSARERKRKSVNYGLEDSYMQEDHNGESEVERKKPKKTQNGPERDDNKFFQVLNPKETKIETEFPIKHESLENLEKNVLDQSARTVFLGNIPSNVISSKADYKTLKRFFSAVGKVCSIRFRSIAFSEQIPRKAAFVNLKLHEKQKTVNAYLIYKETISARAALKLNGSVVLDRHIRVDSVAHPAKQEPNRCIFVGNLDFEAQEEDLWKHFSQCGEVESVRVIRDSKTNFGKGFAYVQFDDSMAVDQALLLNGKKIDGDRKLRITRAKCFKRNKKRQSSKHYIPKNLSSTPVYIPRLDFKQQTNLGRASKFLGRAGAAQLRKRTKVLEGLRVSSTTQSGIKNRDVRIAGTKAKSKDRTTKRSLAWKKKVASK